MGGVASVVSGASGATVSVIVSPVVTSDVVTGPGGGGGSGGWAELVSLDPTAIAPMAIMALAPTVADTNLTCFEFTSDHSISVSGGPTPFTGGTPVG